ncbi:unnamed protein product [Cladocopium goreaui]|uniref:Uncharacterized protein n=1 Tax=Cladocopium goreaui TaxID=2562237 RepID=A0A9P1FWM3_9DINO|nr:unnamed protein product [Cladocopium goreaui]
MAERLSKNFGNLVLGGLGNRNGDDKEQEEESAQTEGEKSPAGKADGGVPEPGAVATYNFMPLRWTMAIPLKEGLQIRCAFCGTAAEGRQFVEKAKSLGQIRELNEVDQQRQKQARQQLVDNVASLKRSHDAAIHLAQLLPAGGRAAKLRRAVSHLGEVLVIGSRVTASRVRSARESVADTCPAEEDADFGDDAVV